MKFNKGDKLEDFYYHVIFAANRGDFKEVRDLIKQNEWWYNMLKPEAKEQLKEMWKIGNQEFENYK